MNALLELAEILKPFAEVADQYDDREDDNFEVWVDAGPERTIRASFKLGNYRRARTALAALAMGSSSLESVVEEAAFLCARLDELDWSVDMDTFASDYNGHVDPSHYRLKMFLERLEKVPAVDMSFFDREPWFETCETPEPPLREIVFRYYRAHFHEEQARQYTDDYLNGLLNPWKHYG